MSDATTAQDEQAGEKLRLGGMALRNGLLVHGPTHWAAAVVRDDGTLAVGSGRKPRVHALDGVAGLRGLARLAEAVWVLPLVKRGLPEAKLPWQDSRVLAAIGAASAGGQLVRRYGKGTVGGEALLAALSVLPSVVTLRGGDVAAWHRVEHKAIAAYESDGDARDAAKEHDRCGSHLVAPMLASNVAGALVLRRLLERPNALAGGALALGSAAVAVEVFAWSERHAGTRTARALRRPGFEIQRVLGTREPDARQLEVGRAALEEILRVEAPADMGSRP
jgi:uncharacterized protein YqhQ